MFGNVTIEMIQKLLRPEHLQLLNHPSIQLGPLLYANVLASLKEMTTPATVLKILQASQVPPSDHVDVASG